MFPTEKNIIVGYVYRPPNQNTAMFIDKFNNVLSLISKDNKHCYVMGDFNQDLLQYNHQVPTQEFIDSLSSHAFLPLIFNPTRLTSYSATLIDHIFTNKLAHSVLSGIILNDLSDHLSVFAYFDDTTLTRRRKRKIVMRTFNEFQTQNGPHFATWKIPIKPTMILLKNIPESITLVSL